MRYGIVMEGWPLPKLTSPSNIKTMAELNRLLGAINSKQCYLRKLSNDEMRAFCQEKAEESASVTSYEFDTSPTSNPPTPVPDPTQACSLSTMTSVVPGASPVMPLSGHLH